MNMDVPTPNYSHVRNYPDVYEPAEDTFLLMDALEEDAHNIKSLNPLTVLEVGCGSGIVSAFVGKMLDNSVYYICTDKNPSASHCCQETGRLNSVNLNPVTTNFIDSLLPHIKHKVDMLIFNPPYVVTPTKEIDDGGIAFAWAGGVKGREVMDKFFPFVPQILSEKGVFYLVTLKENDPEDIICIFRNLGFFSEVLKTRRSGIEILSILRFSRTKCES